MLELPQHIGQRHQPCNQDTRKQPPRTQHPAWSDDQQRHEQRTDRQHDQILVLQSNPAVRPSASHHRPSPVRSSFTANRQISIHASKSYVAVDTRCPTASTNPDTAAHTAASSCPRRELPNSRAINATTTTVRAEASVDTTRSPIARIAKHESRDMRE